MEPEAQQLKLIITYDPLPELREGYLQFVRGEFVPKLEHLGLTMCDAWHTAYGEYPLRLAAFIASDRSAMERVVHSEIFLQLETELQDYVANYTRRVVPNRTTFQY